MKSQKNFSVNKIEFPFYAESFILPYKLILEKQKEWNTMKKNAIVMV